MYLLLFVCDKIYIELNSLYIIKMQTKKDRT
jgi:hypothetical protein